ncbi:MAG: 1-(5-phosphoribosyl)-5-[(5-phosphoribosylamino)methylideneamino]imidazole-4-carboxamide isomerase [Candidatus Omnitrophota bacterium]|jgi:phosphoribosylformimino-5-aminoimidazole carboxamide ribotide isomerase|nr:MAG: 1-(5-phosphoribosyl)-5-[(5-phosphoribosylamino)methylideneamino]imidazole-4-carboxamide isomerase [Candidatus Omnitrophota bacterium]
MLIIPAIDLQNGKVVRLYRGRGRAKVYSLHPAEVAREWVRQGARLLHVVDLDGAMSGRIKNIRALRSIVRTVSVPVQFGGGVRDMRTIVRLLRLGVRRVILGTKAVEDSVFLEKALKKFAGKLAVGVDAEAGKIRIKGWKSSAGSRTLRAFVRSLRESGLTRLIYTDIAKDGALEGPNIKGIAAVLKGSRMKVIASGGFSSLDDIKKVKSLTREGLEGIIVGKALYEKRFTLKAAVQVLKRR